MEYIEMLKKHKFIVMGYEHYNPLGVIRSLGENGIYPIVIMLNANMKIASSSKYVSKLHLVASNEEAFEVLLSEYGEEEKKPFVIPCDDNITELIDERYDQVKDKFFISNAGQCGRITHFQNKLAICQIAEKYGFNVAASWAVKKGEIPEDIVFPIITKPLTSYPGWKEDYFICKDVDELKEAYTKIKGEDILLQQYIKKINELCLDGLVVNHGNEMFISIASKYTYILPDYYSMEMVISNFDDENLKNSFQKIFSEIGYEGIFSAEFMIDENNNLWFLEINFRNSTWSYASTKLGMNLPILWAAGMLLGKLPDNIYRKIPEGYTALAEVADFEQRVRKHKMISFFQWLKGVKNSDCLFYYNKEDRKPIYVIWSFKIKRITKKTVRKLLGKSIG